MGALQRIRERQKRYNKSQQMLKASENKNVFNCRLKAPWHDVLRINSGRQFHMAGPA